MHSTDCLLEELSSTVTNSESVAQLQSMFAKCDRNRVVGKRYLKKKIYKDIYLNMGFTETNDGWQKCMNYGNVLTNYMFPAKGKISFWGKPSWVER